MKFIFFKNFNYKKLLYFVTLIVFIITLFQCLEAFYYLKQIKEYAYSNNASSIELGQYIKYAGRAVSDKREAEIWIKILFSNLLLILPFIFISIKKKANKIKHC